MMYLKIAHRGASAHAPENTLSAFDKAIAMGADMVELDVRATRDGHLVVIHDEHVGRLTGCARSVRDMTLAEIKQIQIGDNERIPTLEEVIRHIGTRCRLYIEIKAPGVEEAVVRMLLENNLQDSAIVGSFVPEHVRNVKRLGPEIRTALLIRSPDEDYVANALAVGASYVHLCWERYPSPHRLLTPEVISKIREHGLGIIIWHEERPEEIAAITKMDIDGICSNNPELL